MSDPYRPLKVTVPPFDQKMSPIADLIWQHTGQHLQTARMAVGDEAAFSIVLSRVMRELRRVAGPEEAKEVLEGFIATMDQAAAGDL